LKNTIKQDIREKLKIDKDLFCAFMLSAYLLFSIGTFLPAFS